MKSIEVVAAIIIDNDKVFATKRGYGEFKGLWEFPGGKVEIGESREDALLREIKEELEVDISIEQFFYTIDYDYPQFHLTMHCYICNIIDGIIVLNEHEASCWSTSEQLDELIWLPADLEIIDHLKKYLN
jgi:8-oxo-dGTP diphosphatase